jgi:hypothetical protein
MVLGTRGSRGCRNLHAEVAPIYLFSVKTEKCVAGGEKYFCAWKRYKFLEDRLSQSIPLAGGFAPRDSPKLCQDSLQALAEGVRRKTELLAKSISRLSIEFDLHQ